MVILRILGVHVAYKHYIYMLAASGFSTWRQFNRQAFAYPHSDMLPEGVTMRPVSVGHGFLSMMVPQKCVDMAKLAYQEMLPAKRVPSGYVRIAIENGHRNSKFSH